MIVDDVITAGTAIREVMALIESLGASTCAVTIALDRQERGQGQSSAIQELTQQGLAVVPIVRLDHIVEFLRADGRQAQCESIEAYRRQYGVD